MGRTVFENPTLCPRVNHEICFWLNVFTGQRRPASCGAARCEVCGPREAWRKSVIISDGGKSGPPKRYAVLTQFPEDWQQGRQKMRNFRRYLQRRGFAWEHAWTIEPNPKGTGHHVNVLQKGSYVPQALLQDVWGAIVHVQAIRGATGAQAVGKYSLKEARRVAGYSLKNGAQGGDVTRAHLEANGGRLVHLSRGYLGGLTQEETWSKIQGPAPEDQGWRLVTR